MLLYQKMNRFLQKAQGYIRDVKGDLSLLKRESKNPLDFVGKMVDASTNGRKRDILYSHALNGQPLGHPYSPRNYFAKKRVEQVINAGSAGNQAKAAKRVFGDQTAKEVIEANRMKRRVAPITGAAALGAGYGAMVGHEKYQDYKMRKDLQQVFSQHYYQ